MLCFAVLAVMNRLSGSDDLKGFDGLSQRSPFLAFALTVGVASLAGVPLTVGFLGKFFVFITAARAQQWPVIIIAVLGAAAGFYYYFKVLRNIYWHKATENTPIIMSALTRSLIVALIALTLFFGVYPKPIMALLQ